MIRLKSFINKVHPFLFFSWQKKKKKAFGKSVPRLCCNELWVIRSGLSGLHTFWTCAEDLPQSPAGEHELWLWTGLSARRSAAERIRNSPGGSRAGPVQRRLDPESEFGPQS